MNIYYILLIIGFVIMYFSVVKFKDTSCAFSGVVVAALGCYPIIENIYVLLMGMFAACSWTWIIINKPEEFFKFKKFVDKKMKEWGWKYQFWGYQDDDKMPGSIDKDKRIADLEEKLKEEEENKENVTSLATTKSNEDKKLREEIIELEDRLKISHEDCNIKLKDMKDNYENEIIINEVKSRNIQEGKDEVIEGKDEVIADLETKLKKAKEKNRKSRKSKQIET